MVGDRLGSSPLSPPDLIVCHSMSLGPAAKITLVENTEASAQLPHLVLHCSLLLFPLHLLLRRPPPFHLPHPPSPSPFSGDRGILFDARNGCRMKSCHGSRWQSWWNLRVDVCVRACTGVCAHACVCVCVYR